jgi:hypothetical protein
VIEGVKPPVNPAPPCSACVIRTEIRHLEPLKPTLRSRLQAAMPAHLPESAVSFRRLQ